MAPSTMFRLSQRRDDGCMWTVFGLLNKGADANARTSDGICALILAVQAGNLSIAENACSMQAPMSRRRGQMAGPR